MSARAYEIDRVARAMTSGAPAAAFTDRVMAPIHGRPQPWFTARVMARLDTPRLGWTVHAREVALAGAGALALATAAAWWLPDSRPVPVAPDAPRVAARPLDGLPHGSQALPERTPAPRTPARRNDTERTPAQARSGVDAPTDTAALPATPSIYVIEQLAPPAELAVRALDAPPRTTPPLPAPKVLTLPEIRINPFRENP